MRVFSCVVSDLGTSFSISQFLFPTSRLNRLSAFNPQLFNMPTQVADPREYQDIFHWAETQKDGTIPSFAVRKNDPYEVVISNLHLLGPSV